MSSNALIVLIAAGAGVALAVQANFMGVLDRNIGTRESVFITYAGGGLLITLLMLLVWRGGNLAAWRSVPPYALLPGVMGLLIVGAISYATSRFGLVATFAIILAAQYTSGALIDHFGLFGAPVRPLDLGRLLGMVVLAAGAWLVVR